MNDEGWEKHWSEGLDEIKGIQTKLQGIRARLEALEQNLHIKEQENER